MIKRIIALLIVFNLALSLHAQVSATISGRVFDASDNIPLPFTTVALYDKETDALVSGAVCDADGRFTLEGIPSGDYYVRFSFIGYEDNMQDLLIGELNTIFDMGRIELQPTTEDIDEVTVRAQREEVSFGMEKRTYSMDDNIAQAGGSVLDALKVMPGITVDQEGKVMLRGSDKVVVLVDGKQSSLTGFGSQKGLDNIPAYNIDQIEIITNPSARYDASGMAGIINIIYKKEKERGFNGDIGLTYGLGALTRPVSDLPTDLGSYKNNNKITPGLNLNYRSDKSNIFLQAEVLRQHALPNNEFTTRCYDDGRITASQVPENRTQTHYIINGGIDFFLDDMNTLTFSGIYDYEHHIDTAQVPYINIIDDERYRYITWMEEEITGFMNYALNYEHRFAEAGHELNANIQYTRGWEDETYNLNDSSEVRTGRDRTNILAIEHITSLSLDYIRPLRMGRLESGGKIQIRRLPVEFTVWPGINSMIYPGLGEWSDWGENIYSAYINLVQEKTKFDIEAGLRTEYTDVFYDIDPDNIYYSENDSYNYFELFPSIRFTWKLNSNNRISAFYNRRIDRPGEPELRIFTKSDDHELVKSGNPYLRPQFTQSVELAYKLLWGTGSASLSAFYRRIKDPFMRIYSIDENNYTYDVITKIYANTGRADNSGLEIIFGQDIFKFWRLSGNVNYYKNLIYSYTGTLLFPYEHDFTIEESVDNTWDIKVTNQLNISTGFEIQLTAVYYAPKNIPQGRELARSSVDIGIVKNVFNDRGEINLSASDIFNDFGIRQEINGDGFEAFYENYYETQVFRVSFKYKF